MKKLLFTFSAVITLGLVVFLVFTFSQKAPPGSLPPAQRENAVRKDNTAGKNADSRYVEYAGGVLDTLKDKKRVLFFYANWCPVCKPADESFRVNENKIPEDVVVIRVNYNDSETDQEEKDLAKKYGISYQHTYVQIDANGNEVSKWNGGQIDELLSNLK